MVVIVRHNAAKYKYILFTIPKFAGKYSSGAELTSLAHSSALQAKTAVQNQQTAGSQAAFGAKSSLAQAALGVSYIIYFKMRVY